MPGTVVRHATPEDAPTLGRLNRFVHDPHTAADPGEYVAHDLEAVTAHFAEVLSQGAHVVLVAEADDGEAVGYVDAEVLTREASPFTRELRVLYVHQLAVADTRRRTGVGRLLMAAVENEGRVAGATEVRLEHQAFNEEAHGFYEALGYHPAAVKMRKSLR